MPDSRSSECATVDGAPERVAAATRLRALFREVNDEIAKLVLTTRQDGDVVALLCECGDPLCVERLQVPAEAYAAARSASARQYVLRRGHEADGAAVVLDGGEFVVVDGGTE